jgi:hypothetical protein
LGAEPQRGRLDELWAKLLLDGEDGTQQAYHAMRELARTSEATAAFLRERLHPVPALTPAVQRQLDEWLVALDSSDFPTRRRATRSIEALGDRARPAICARLEQKPNLEVRQRLERLIEQFDSCEPTVEEQRDLRAIEVLKGLQSPAAKALLARLADGGAGARRTEAARAALAILQK